MIKNYTINQIAGIVDGKLVSNSSSSHAIKDLLIDSRMLASPATTLFFALMSPRNDGHKYIDGLSQKGVRNFVISQKDFPTESYPQANFIFVSDTLVALQKLSAARRQQFDIPVIGITGSNGKTIVKEWLYQLLSPEYNLVRSPKSYNSQIGVPLSVWQMNEQNQLAIFEAGISQPGEMQKLQAVIQPTIGIFTNIGNAHDENFTGIRQKLNEKFQLFGGVNLLICRNDIPEINEYLRQFSQQKSMFTWGKNPGGNLWLKNIRKSKGHSLLTLDYQDKELKLFIPFTDTASIENSVHCCAMMLVLGYAREVIAQRINRLQPVAMRLELKEGINNCSIINDSYSSDIYSLNIALDFLNQQKQHAKKTVILSDILQSGKKEKELYSEIASLLAKKHVNRIIGIGEAISHQAHQFKMEKTFYPSTHDFLNSFQPALFYDETILLKGARIFEFEKIGRLLQQKAHETILEINLNALIDNLNYFRSKLNPSTKLMAMVKAFSYGSGSFEIANTLQFHHADYLTVAYADEGVELRKGGITLPIMVMNPEEQSFDEMIQHKLEPEIYNFRVLRLLEEALQRSNTKNFPVHIKLDTGMHRLGFEESELEELVNRLTKLDNIRVQSAFSHLATADEPEQDEFTRLQLERFTRMSNYLKKNIPYPFLLHVLNSVGITRFPEAQFDMVRLGIGLYGIATAKADEDKLKNVTTLKTIISQIKHILAGDSVGYSRKWIAAKDSVIATIPIGYADGLSRKLGNGKGKVMINGNALPIIGNICMDMCMVDITGFEAIEGDEVIIFGDDFPITRLADALETIPYEILTGISRRVKRIYYQE